MLSIREASILSNVLPQKLVTLDIQITNWFISVLSCSSLQIHSAIINDCYNCNIILFSLTYIKISTQNSISTFEGVNLSVITLNLYSPKGVENYLTHLFETVVSYMIKNQNIRHRALPQE